MIDLLCVQFRAFRHDSSLSLTLPAFPLPNMSISVCPTLPWRHPASVVGNSSRSILYAGSAISSLAKMFLVLRSNTRYFTTRESSCLSLEANVRNVGRIKLGYYPLPQEEGNRLRNLLDVLAFGE